MLYTTTVQSRIRSFLVENENFGMSFFYLYTGFHGHSTGMSNLNIRSLSLVLQFANARGGAQYIRFLQPTTFALASVT